MFSGFMSLMQQGGWDMWLLLLISIVGLAVVIERLVFFATQHGDTKGLLRAIGTKDCGRRSRRRDQGLPAATAACSRAFSSSVCGAARRTAPTSPTRSRSR